MDRRGFFKGAGAAVAAVAVAPAVNLVHSPAAAVEVDHAANEAIVDGLVQRDLSSTPVRDKQSNCPRCYLPGDDSHVWILDGEESGNLYYCQPCGVTWTAR